MTALVRFYIKTGMLWLTAALLLLLADSVPGLDTGFRLLPLYWHMLAIGWITQIIIGVSLWMFPAHCKEHRERPPLGRTIWFLLNAGLILRMAFEPFTGAGMPAPEVRVGILASLILQAGALILYVAVIWPRVQPKPHRKRRVNPEHSPEGTRKPAGKAVHAAG